jgi:hypothetical protein
MRSVRSVRPVLGLGLRRGGKACLTACPRRALSSFTLHSPMYPQYPVKEVEAKPWKEGDPPEDDDFLSRHGGKIALAGFGFAMLLVYRWVKGGSNKNTMESDIRASFLVDPIEFSELRHNNNIGGDLYNDIIADAYAAFPDSYASYPDFISFVQSKLNGAKAPPLAYAHILDRLILPSVEAGHGEISSEPAVEPAADHASIEGPEWRAELSANGRLPLSFLLVAFNAAVRERADKRASALFRISVGSADSLRAADAPEACTEDQLRQLVKDLLSSCQVLILP